MVSLVVGPCFGVGEHTCILTIDESLSEKERLDRQVPDIDMVEHMMSGR